MTPRKPVATKRKRAKAEVSGVSMSICRYRIQVGDHEWAGDSIDGMGRDLEEALGSGVEIDITTSPAPRVRKGGKS